MGVGRISNYGGGQKFTDVTAVGFVLNKTIMQMQHINKAITYGAPAVLNNDFNGLQYQIAPTDNFGQGFRMASGGVLGGASTLNETFYGSISETFYYEKELTLQEQNLVRSYVGAKYGIILRANPNSSPKDNFNYILSNSTSVWNGLQAPFSTYHYNEAGLVRDNQSSLDMRVSKSVEPGALVTMMFSGDDPCKPQVSGFANDFLAVFLVIIM